MSRPSLPGPHGTRTVYKRGCRCLPCRAANAAYARGWYRSTQQGRLLLGARCSAVEAWHLLRWLKREGMTAQRLGYEFGIQAVRCRGRQVTWRTLLKLRRLVRGLFAGSL